MYNQVVDLWGSADPTYTPNTLTNVFSRFSASLSSLSSPPSSTKSLTAIAMAAMYEEGLLSYDSRYCQPTDCCKHPDA